MVSSRVVPPARSVRMSCPPQVLRLKKNLKLHQGIWENPRKIIVFAAWRIYELTTKNNMYIYIWYIHTHTCLYIYIYMYICIWWSYWSAWLFTLFCVAAVAQFFRQVPKRRTIPDRRRITSTNRINAGHLSHGEGWVPDESASDGTRWIRITDILYILCMYVCM